MSEYSRWREWRSTATTAKPTAGHAKCRPPPSSRARQGHANDSTPRTPSAPPTPSHPSTPGTRTPSAPPVPSRAAKTGGTPRAAKTGLLVARPPTQRPRTPSKPCAADNAEPSIDSKHAHAKCATYAEPSRQDRRHAADSTPAIGEPSQMPRMPSRPCATDAEPPIDSWHTHSKCAACAEPSRQDRRHAADSTPAIGEPSQIPGANVTRSPTEMHQPETSVSPPQPRMELRNAQEQAPDPRTFPRSFIN
jgi:hypothetical protein